MESMTNCYAPNVPVVCRLLQTEKPHLTVTRVHDVEKTVDVALTSRACVLCKHRDWTTYIIVTDKHAKLLR